LKNKNTYENTEMTNSGANKYMSGLHNRCIRTNQYVWDMMKVLDKEEMYGFHFKAKVGAKKILVILHHEDNEKLDKAQKILKHVEKNSDVLFLTKLKEKKSHNRVWIIAFSIIFLCILIIFTLSFTYKKGYFDEIIEQYKSAKVVEESKVEKEPVIEEIVVDMEKLKLLKESFDEENATTLSPKAMATLTIITGIISEEVSEEEKSKYSTEELVKSFKGKSGFKLVVKDETSSKEFNATVKELNSYAMHFIKENNLSEALKYYDKVSQEDNVSKKEAMMSSYHQAEIFEEMGLNEEAKSAYNNALKLNEVLTENNQTVDKLNQLVSLGRLAKLHQDINEPKQAEEIIKKAKNLYKLLIIELKKYGELKSEELALSLNYLANFYTSNNENLLSIEIRKEALKIYERFLQKEYKKFALTYYKTLNSLAESYLRIEKIELAKQNYEIALALMEKMVKSKIVENRGYIALSYRALAMVAIKYKQLKKAKNYYLDALSIYQNLVKKEKAYYHEITDMHGEFAGLYTLEKKFKLAQKEYKKGILKFVQMNKKRPLKYNLKIAKLLNSSSFMKISNFDMNSTELVYAKVELRKSKQLGREVIEVNFKKAKKSIAKSYAYLAYIAGRNKQMLLAIEYYQISSALIKVKGIKEFRLLNLNLH